jgi:hypothetical protein
MNTRRLLSAAVLSGLMLAPVPALAKSDAAKIAKQLRDPQMQGAMAAAVRAMSDAMLDMNIAPLLNAAEAVRDPYDQRRVDPDTRLRDYAGRDAEEMPDRLSRRLPAMMGAMGGMAEAVEEMTPALKGMAKQMGAAVGASMAGARSGASDPRDEPYDDRDIPSATED